MDTSTVILNLAWLIPLSLCSWLPAPRLGKFDGDPGWFVALIMKSGFVLIKWIILVSLGGFLSAAVALAYGERLNFAPFRWTDDPLFALQALGMCAVVGAGWSYGVAHFIGKLLQRLIEKSTDAQRCAAAGADFAQQSDL